MSTAVPELLRFPPSPVPRAMLWGALAMAMASPGLARAATEDTIPAAKETPKDDPDAPVGGGVGEQIVVIAGRFEGEIAPPQAPVATLEEADIAAYGASNLTDLIGALTVQTGSGRGRGGGSGGGGPVILVNGLRISSFRELRNYPPEAIARVQIFPEEVALAYGFAPDQRVVNLVLKKNFSSRTAEVEYQQPDRGGTSTSELEASLLKLSGRNRLNLAITADRTTPLTEAERGVIQQPGSTSTVPGDPDPAAARTLVARGSNTSGNASFTVPLGEGPLDGTLTLNATLSRANSLALQGLPLVQLTAPDGTTALRTLPSALTRNGRTDTVQGGAALNRPLGGWQLSATLDASHVRTTTQTALRPDSSALVAAAAAGQLAITGPLPAPGAAGFANALNLADTATALVTANGSLFALPAGPVRATLRGGFAYTGSQSSDSRSLAAPLSLKRGDASAGLNLTLPITSRRENFGGAIGDLSLNLNAGLDHLSDFGTLFDWTVGANWSPTQKLSLQASYIVNQSAPSLAQLGAPLVQNANVAVFDFATGQTVLVSTLSGGNPALPRQTQRDLKLGLNWQPAFLGEGSFQAEYFANRSSNVATGFPLLTSAIEAAFPGRVVRDAAGRLVSLDLRPITFARQTEQRIRYGLVLSGKLGKPLPPGATGGEGFGVMGQMMRAMGGGRPGGGANARGPGGPRGPGGGPPGGGARGQGRWNLAIYHTVQLQSRVLVAPGGPVLDLLNGDALTSSGGVARHSVELDAGGFYRGYGLRANGTWSAPTRIEASGAPGSADLRFGSVFKLNLRLFADLGQMPKLTKAVPFLKGARFSLMANNVFDSRQKVTDANGITPIAYQKSVLDPQGRVLGVEFRKLF